MLGNGRDSRLSASKLTERSRELELTKHGEETSISSFSFFSCLFLCDVLASRTQIKAAASADETPP